jgi:hypothetical protein
MIARRIDDIEPGDLSGVGRRQLFAIDLAVDRLGEGDAETVTARNHVTRQPIAKIVRDVGSGDMLRSDSDVSDDRFLAIDFIVRDKCFEYIGMSAM